MKKFKGFTIIEIMSSLSIFLIIMLLVGSVYILAQRTYNRGTSQNELIQNARVCLDRLSRELRQAEFLVTDVSATTTELYFQDGHNDNYISYIKYYLIGSDLYRAHKAYYFPPWPVSPDEYVFYNSVDAWGSPAASTTLDLKIIGEYFNSLQFRGTDGLITITANLTKNNINLNIDSKAYIRNW
jgi:prepilin-type N-terminal cleavage/methylation domain-containing protein